MSTKNALDFSAKANGIHFHIRAPKPAPLSNEYMAQTVHMHYAWELQYLFDGEAERIFDILYPKTPRQTTDTKRAYYKLHTSPIKNTFTASILS